MVLLVLEARSSVSKMKRADICIYITCVSALPEEIFQLREKTLTISNPQNFMEALHKLLYLKFFNIHAMSAHKPQNIIL